MKRQPPTAEAAERAQRGARPFRLRNLVLFLGFILCMLLMLGIFQRSLIYFPIREQQIAPQDAGLPPGQVRTIVVPTADQLQLRGWHILPDQAVAAAGEQSEANLADARLVVLYFSGNAGNRAYRTDEFQTLTSLGAHVVNVDYRGYGDNPGSPSEQALVADAHAIWQQLAVEHGVRPEQVLLFGESLGGAVAVRLAATLCQQGTPPKGLLLRSVFPSLVHAGRYHYPWLPVRMLLIDRYMSLDHIQHVCCPILQIHGRADRIVPIQLGRQLFEAAPSRSGDGHAKRFVELPRAGHNDIPLVAAGEYRAAIRQFLEDLSC